MSIYIPGYLSQRLLYSFDTGETLRAPLNKSLPEFNLTRFLLASASDKAELVEFSLNIDLGVANTLNIDLGISDILNIDVERSFDLILW